MQRQLSEVDKTAIDIMLQAGKSFAETQFGRHRQNEWHLRPAQQAEFMQHWKAVSARISELASILRAVLRDKA